MYSVWKHDGIEALNSHVTTDLTFVDAVDYAEANRPYIYGVESEDDANAGNPLILS